VPSGWADRLTKVPSEVVAGAPAVRSSVVVEKRGGWVVEKKGRWGSKLECA
jgi:hypothetical protein